MNPLIQKLLAPVSEAQPCGPDLSYDPKFDELETILKGKPEVEIGSVQKPAEPPEWGRLREASARFLTESKHLRVGIMLGCSLLKTEGISGFRDGLELTKAWLEQYWSTVYPLLDAEDNNDPTQRLNTLGVLTAPRGSVTGWLTILDYLYAAEACRPKGSPAIRFEDLIEASAKPESDSQRSSLNAVIRKLDAGDIPSQIQVLEESLALVKSIDQILGAALGSGGSINFEALEKTLGEMISVLRPYLQGSSAQAAAVSGVEAVSAHHSGGNESSVAPISGAVRTREDVVRALDKICDYYQLVEPGSPIPYLLRRAQKLAKMDFVQVVQELNLGTVDSLRPSMGSALDKEEGAAG